jgi:hypothetical protein
LGPLAPLPMKIFADLLRWQRVICSPVLPTLS